MKRKVNIGLNVVRPGMWVNYIRSLFDRNIEGGTILETQIGGPPYIEGLDRDFTKEAIKDCLRRMKKNAATVVKGLPAETQKIFCAKKEGI